MTRSLSRSLVRLAAWFGLLICLQWTTAPLAQAQTPLPWHTPATPLPSGSRPQMAYTPPATAVTLADFAPPGTPQETVAALTEQTAVAALPADADKLVNFDGGHVAVAAEPGTLAGPATLAFTSQAVPGLPLTATNTLSDSLETITLLRFQLELTDDASGQPLTDFAKPMRLVVDLRPLTTQFDPGYGRFFLAYEDETTPGIWHEVPVDVHQPGGLISAEVTHFSGWAAGVRPERWNPAWNPPTVSAFSGAATFSYPIETPAGRGGLQPQVSLSYSSRGLDGRIRDGEAGPIGDGWSLAEISIVRVGVKMKSPNGVPLTHHPDQFRLVFNGSGHELYPQAGVDTATAPTVRYFVKDAPGYFVERNFSSAAPNADGLFWILITPDGTRYRLGYTADAEEWQQVPASLHIQVDGHTGIDQPSAEISAIAWHVDTVTDSFGNQMTYHYLTKTETETIDWWNSDHWTSFPLTTHSTRIDSIRYNYPDRVLTLPAADDVDQLTSTPATRIEFRSANLTNGDTAFLINSVFVYHGDGTTPIAEYRIHSQGKFAESPGCLNHETNEPQLSHTRVVRSIQKLVGTDGEATTADAGFALPPLTFYYGDDPDNPDDFSDPLPHFDRDIGPCFRFYYLRGFDNGYGGRVRFDYTSDGRSIGNYWLEEAAPNVLIQHWPQLGYNYTIHRSSSEDGRNPATVTTYSYGLPCYGQWRPPTPGTENCGGPDAPEFGNLVGHQTATQTFYDFDQSTVLSQQVTTFSQEAGGSIGRPLQVDVLDAGDNLLTRQETSYTTEIYANGGDGDTDNDATFTYTDQVINRQVQGSDSLSTKTTYAYNPAYQGGVQLGHLTHTQEYDDADATAPYRSSVVWYAPNTDPGHWLVDRPVADALYAGDIDPANLVNGTWHYYDDATDILATPTQGKLTRSRAFVPVTCGEVPGGGDCTFARQTIDTGYKYDPFGNQTNIITYEQYGYRTFDSGGTQINDLFATGPLTATITFENEYHLYPIAASNQAGQITSFEIYGFNGVPLDGFQHQPGLLRQVTNIDGTMSKYEYDPFGRLHAIYDGDASTGTPFAGFGDASPWDGDPLTRYRYWDNTWNHDVTYLDPAGDVPFVITSEQRPQSWPIPAEPEDGFAYVSQSFFDGYGRAIQTQDYFHEVEGYDRWRDRISQTAYDARGQAACQAGPYDLPFAGDRPGTLFVTTPCTDPSLALTTTEYDTLGRPIRIIAPDGTESTSTYEIVTGVTVDGRDRMLRTTITDADNHLVRQYSNSLGQMAMIREMEGDGSADDPYTPYADTRYYYDRQDNLIFVGRSDANDNEPTSWLADTTMSYDGYGRKTAMIDPDMGHWTYDYNPAGNIIEQVDGNDTRLCFTFDSLNRLTHKRHDEDENGCDAQDTLLATFAFYDSGSGKTGKPSEIRWGSSSTQNRETFDYDSLGRLTSHNRWIDERQYTQMTNSYDPMHRPLTTLSPSGELISLTYDREGENSLSAGADPLVQNIIYDGRGQLTFLDRAGSADTIFSYFPAAPLPGDEAGNGNFRLQRIQHGDYLTDKLPDFDYTYERTGNLHTLDTIYNSGGITYLDSQTFSYDHLNRLQTAYATGNVANYDHSDLNGDYAYAYDRLGNIIRFGGEPTDYDYTSWSQDCLTLPSQPLPHAVKQIGSNYFCYDGNGNMTKRVEDGVTYEQNFNVENELESVIVNGQTTSFFYDTSGLRVKTIKPGGETIHTPFPNYEVTIETGDWTAVDPPPSGHLSTPADHGRFLHTDDASGWGLSTNQAEPWHTLPLPTAVNPYPTSQDAEFSATSLYTGDGVGEPHSGDDPVALNNLANGAARSPGISLIPGRQYRLRFWVKGNLSTGGSGGVEDAPAIVRVLPFNDPNQAITLWSTAADPVSDTWQEKDVTFVMPSSIIAADSVLELAAEQLNGWVAFDDLRLHEISAGQPYWGGPGGGGTETLIYNNRFESNNQWTLAADASFPATSLWIGGNGPGMPLEGTASLVLSNLGQSTLSSSAINLDGSGDLAISLQWQQDLADRLSGSSDGVALMIRFYDSGDGEVGAVQLHHSSWMSNGTAWQPVNATVPGGNIPTTAVSFKLSLEGSFYDGWLAIDDVTVVRGEEQTLLATWNFETDTWSHQPDPAFPAGTIWHGDTTPFEIGSGSGHAYALTTRSQATAVTDWFDTVPFQQFRITAWRRGMAPGLLSGGQIWAQFYNSTQLVQTIPIDEITDFSLPDWGQVSEAVTTPIYADRFRLLVRGERLGGWLAVDDLTIQDLTQPAPWRVDDTWSIISNETLPATSTANDNTAGQPHSGNGRALTLHNLAQGSLEHPNVSLNGGDSYTLKFWTRSDLVHGQVKMELLPFGDNAQTILLWDVDSDGSDPGAWQEITVIFTMPSSGSTQPSVLRLLTDEPLDGWLAIDDMRLYAGSNNTSQPPIFADGFETADWAESADPAYPATLVRQAGGGPITPVEGDNVGFIGNLGHVSLVSPRVAVSGGNQLMTTFAYQTGFATAGSQFSLAIRAYDENQGLLEEVQLWQTAVNTNGWQTDDSGVYTLPTDAAEIELMWQAQTFAGWAALDDILLDDLDLDLSLAIWDLESDPGPDGWALQPHSQYPAGTGWWADDDGDPSGNEYYLISNEAGGMMQTGLFPAPAGATHFLRAYAKTVGLQSEPTQLWVHFFNDGTSLTRSLLWESDLNGVGPIWQPIQETFVIPAQATDFRIEVEAPRVGGAVALDGLMLADLSQNIPAQGNQDYTVSAMVAGEAPAAGLPSAALIVAFYDASGGQIGSQVIWGGVDYNQPLPITQRGSFTTPPGTARVRIGVAAGMDNDAGEGWLTYDQVRLTALSGAIPYAPGQSVNLSANIMGELNGPTGTASGELAIHFYDDQGNLVGIDSVWLADGYNQPTTPQLQSGSAVHANATQMRVGLNNILDHGWLDFSDITLTMLTEPLSVNGDQNLSLETEIGGELDTANGGRLFIKFSNGTEVDLWQNATPYNSTQTVSYDFTSPVNITSLQVGTAVMLDKGHLAFDDVKLTAFSDSIPVNAANLYRLTMPVTGTVAAGLGQGGRVTAVFNNDPTNTDILWRNPANFNGTVQLQKPFTIPAGSASLQIALQANLSAGMMDFGNIDLQFQDDGTLTERSHYSVAGQATAVRVRTLAGGGQGSDDLYFIYSDHLGSTSLLVNAADNSPVEESRAYYLPFGGYRGTHPSQTLTDHDFTGQKQNRELGLLYYNARYYLPGIGRFASADTLIPDPTNPQAFNRFSYVLNNPHLFLDPTGHVPRCNYNRVTNSVCIDTYNGETNERHSEFEKTNLDGFTRGAINTLTFLPYADTADDLLVFTTGCSTSCQLGYEEPVGWGWRLIAGTGTFGPWGYRSVRTTVGLADEGIGFVSHHGEEALGWLRRVGNFCSFSADTLVLTEDGPVPISKLRPQDKVLGYDEETGEIGFFPIVAVWSHEDPVIVFLTIDGETIVTTPNHPFLTMDGEWVWAAHLQPGNEIRNADWGTGTVESILFTATPQTMYNLTVETAHTYFVGDGQWLVHNGTHCTLPKRVRDFVLDSFDDPTEMRGLYLEMNLNYNQLVPENATTVDSANILINHVEEKGLTTEFYNAVMNNLNENQQELFRQLFWFGE